MKRKKWLWYAGIGIIGASVFSLLYTQLTAYAPLATTQQRKNTIYPTQYSDTHITKNAMATDQRFKDLAVFDKENFLASAAASLQTNKPVQGATQPEKGTWLWTPTLDLTPAYWNALIAGAKKNGIQTIYLSIDSYLDIYVMPDGPEKK
ncbi:MAG: hypothetical protein AAB850_00145, partial [Patescibacteria group bacterium]